MPLTNWPRHPHASQNTGITLFLPSAGHRLKLNSQRLPKWRPEDKAMGGLSIWHWIIVIGVVLLLFGRGKISELMGDVAQGIKAFKKGMADDDTGKANTE